MSEVKSKKCSGLCGKTLELNAENFHKRKGAYDGFSNKCKNCAWQREIFNFFIEENGIKYQICTGKCGLKLEVNKNNFQWRNDTKSWRLQCNNCRNLGKGKPKHIIEENELKYQICIGECKRKLEINEENFSKTKTKGKILIFKRICKMCLSIISKEYKKKNIKILTENHKKHRANPENKKIRNEQEKNKRKNDPSYKLRQNVSNTINKYLKRMFNSKNGKSCLKYLPYLKFELKEHIEKQFLEPGNEWMTWDNWGIYNPKTWDDNDPSTWKWNLDHIFPQADFEYASMEDTEFLECWDLKNLRPYSAKQNVIDGATRVRHKKNRNKHK